MMARPTLLSRLLMPRASVAAVIVSRPRLPASEQSFGKRRSNGWIARRIATTARALWRNKTAEEMATRSGVTVRAAENYLAGDRCINGNALANLLLAEPEFMSAMLDELTPAARRRWLQELEISEMRVDLRLRIAQLSVED
jgi:hypothetical protein